MDKHSHSTDHSRPGYQNRILTVIAVLLALLVVQRADLMPGAGDAHAFQSREPQAPPNAAVQRVKMIQELEKIERRMDSIEKKLSGPLNVNVLSMPVVKVEE
ncbi:MAG: hypothetical protein ACNA8P_09750 [Phycisphaerales bacterium]